MVLKQKPQNKGRSGKPSFGADPMMDESIHYSAKVDLLLAGIELIKNISKVAAKSFERLEHSLNELRNIFDEVDYSPEDEKKKFVQKDSAMRKFKRNKLSRLVTRRDYYLNICQTIEGVLLNLREKHSKEKNKEIVGMIDNYLEGLRNTINIEKKKI